MSNVPLLLGLTVSEITKKLNAMRTFLNFYNK
jgi:hypothetical protein